MRFVFHSVMFVMIFALKRCSVHFHHVRVITKGKSKLIDTLTDKINQQTENCENRNDPDLVQAFIMKWWVESDFKAPNLPLSLRLKCSGCHSNSIYNNTICLVVSYFVYVFFLNVFTYTGMKHDFLFK